MQVGNNQCNQLRQDFSEGAAVVHPPRQWPSIHLRSPYQTAKCLGPGTAQSSLQQNRFGQHLRHPLQKLDCVSMSGLFIPTYGSPAEGSSTRVLPSKQVVSNNKRRVPSGMPSLVFNGNIEYVQVSDVRVSHARVLGYVVLLFLALGRTYPCFRNSLCCFETRAKFRYQTNSRRLMKHDSTAS